MKEPESEVYVIRILFFIDLSTQRVEISRIARSANGAIHDRNPLYTQEFLSMLAEAGMQSVKLPARSPNLNAYAERFVKTIKESCLERMILFGEDSLRNAV